MKKIKIIAHKTFIYFLVLFQKLPILEKVFEKTRIKGAFMKIASFLKC